MVNVCFDCLWSCRKINKRAAAPASTTRDIYTDKLSLVVVFILFHCGDDVVLSLVVIKSTSNGSSCSFIRRQRVSTGGDGHFIPNNRRRPRNKHRGVDVVIVKCTILFWGTRQLHMRWRGVEKTETRKEVNSLIHRGATIKRHLVYTIGERIQMV